MGKGPDQGDFETPTADTSSPDGPWPTEPEPTTPDDETVAPTTPSEAPTSTADDATTSTSTSTSTASSSEPGDVGQLPTTSGTDPVVGAVALVTAFALVGAGLVMALRNRKRTDW